MGSAANHSSYDRQRGQQKVNNTTAWGTWVSRNSTAPATEPVHPHRSTVDQNWRWKSRSLSRAGCPLGGCSSVSAKVGWDDGAH